MAKKSSAIHTVPSSEGGWDNKKDGRTISHYDLKREAVDAGRERAKRDQAEHVVHNKDGRISGSNSYGNDPFPPRG